MSEYLIAFALSIIGVISAPQNLEKKWETRDWSGDKTTFQTESFKIPKECGKKINSYLQLPFMIETQQEILLSNKSYIFNSHADVFSHYSGYSIPCKELINTNKLVWKAKTYSQAYSFFHHYPKIVSKPYSNFINYNFLALSSGILIMLGFLLPAIFSGKIRNSEIIFLISISSFLFGFHFMFTVPSFFGIHTNISVTHQLTEIFAWFGSSCLIEVFRRKKLLVPSKLCFAQYFSVLFSCFLSIFSFNTYIISLAAIFPFAITIILFFISIIHLVIEFLVHKKIDIKSLQILSLLVFSFCVINDILVLSGNSESYILLGIGILFCNLSLSFFVNEDIKKVYKQHDEMLEDLEKKVFERTRRIDAQSKRIATIQAESARKSHLASIGIMSSGLAHEIGNSLNGIGISLRQLKKNLVKLEDEKTDVSKMLKAHNNIKYSAELAKNILSNMTCLSKKESFVSFNLKNTIDQTVSMLGISSKVEITVEAPSKELYQDKTFFIQMILNLSKNSFYALENKSNSRIKIIAILDQKNITFEMHDSGSGVPDSLKDKIFEPFFTTKPTDRGTGLGLHVIRDRVYELGGNISVSDSTDLGGALFKIILPVIEEGDKHGS